MPPTFVLTAAALDKATDELGCLTSTIRLLLNRTGHCLQALVSAGNAAPQPLRVSVVTEVQRLCSLISGLSTIAISTARSTSASITAYVKASSSPTASAGPIELAAVAQCSLDFLAQLEIALLDVENQNELNMRKIRGALDGGDAARDVAAVVNRLIARLRLP